MSMDATDARNKFLLLWTQFVSECETARQLDALSRRGDEERDAHVRRALALSHHLTASDCVRLLIEDEDRHEQWSQLLDLIGDYI